MSRDAILFLESARDPFVVFENWFAEARRTSTIRLPEAMTVSTIDPEGHPDSRKMLLKGVDNRGFVFYTNRQSRKGKSLAKKPYAALLFFWEPLGRQVRIQGPVESVSSSEADAYFATRPRVSQLGAWASQQSEPLESRQALETRLHEYEKTYMNKEVRRPPHWSGYRLLPNRIEFCIEGEYRLHDRFLFSRSKDQWTRSRLNP